MKNLVFFLSNVSICSAHGHLIKHAGANDTGSKQPQTTMVFATSQPMLQAQIQQLLGWG
jgi:hypothetical protein